MNGGMRSFLANMGYLTDLTSSGKLFLRALSGQFRIATAITFLKSTASF
jgi:hypothetical protein